MTGVVCALVFMHPGGSEAKCCPTDPRRSAWNWPSTGAFSVSSRPPTKSSPEVATDGVTEADLPCLEMRLGHCTPGSGFKSRLVGDMQPGVSTQMNPRSFLDSARASTRISISIACS
uniref:Putative secreted protein n=1 Tax=Ixodes ricinus TaxID=34613 RepID=A0A6B0ULG4_IXORI